MSIRFRPPLSTLEDTEAYLHANMSPRKIYKMAVTVNPSRLAIASTVLGVTKTVQETGLDWILTRARGLGPDCRDEERTKRWRKIAIEMLDNMPSDLRIKALLFKGSKCGIDGPDGTWSAFDTAAGHVYMGGLNKAGGEQTRREVLGVLSLFELSKVTVARLRDISSDPRRVAWFKELLEPVFALHEGGAARFSEILAAADPKVRTTKGYSPVLSS